MKTHDETKRYVGQAIVYLMRMQQIRQIDVANYLDCTVCAVNHTIYGKLKSKRINTGLCELMGYANRDQLEIAACEALNKVQEAHPKRKAANV